MDTEKKFKDFNKVIISMIKTLQYSEGGMTDLKITCPDTGYFVCITVESPGEEE